MISYNKLEYEILIARSIDAVYNNFQCDIIGYINGIQLVSLYLYGDAKPVKNDKMQLEQLNVDLNNSRCQNKCNLEHAVQQLTTYHTEMVRIYIDSMQRKLTLFDIVPDAICLVIAAFYGRDYELIGKKK
eukprot:243856_1